jgi:hypothetical protein
LVRWTQTTLTHRAPDVVFRRYRPIAPSISVLQRARVALSFFSAQAAARARMAACQRALLDLSLSSTLAAAQPEPRVRILVASLKNNPPAKALIDFDHGAKSTPRYGRAA